MSDENDLARTPAEPVRSLHELGEPASLPDALVELFRGEVALGLTLSVRLPPGRVVHGGLVVDGGADDGREQPEPAALWLSDEVLPDAGACWARLRAEHRVSGLWPLLADTVTANEPSPWRREELMPMPPGLADVVDAGTFLAGRWADLVATQTGEVLAPYGVAWPGLALTTPAQHDPDWLADRIAEAAAPCRLGLVAAGLGSGALAACGWRIRTAPAADTPELAAVVRSWENRFGVRVVAAGPDSLRLSVAAPPGAAEQARQLAAEHLAFCPRLVLGAAGTLRSYAETLPSANMWIFDWR